MGSFLKIITQSLIIPLIERAFLYFVKKVEKYDLEQQIKKEREEKMDELRVLKVELLKKKFDELP